MITKAQLKNDLREMPREKLENFAVTYDVEYGPNTSRDEVINAIADRAMGELKGTAAANGMLETANALTNEELITRLKRTNKPNEWNNGLNGGFLNSENDARGKFVSLPRLEEANADPETIHFHYGKVTKEPSNANFDPTATSSVLPYNKLINACSEQAREKGYLLNGPMCTSELRENECYLSKSPRKLRPYSYTVRAKAKEQLKGADFKKVMGKKICPDVPLQEKEAGANADLGVSLRPPRSLLANANYIQPVSPRKRSPSPRKKVEGEEHYEPSNVHDVYNAFMTEPEQLGKTNVALTATEISNLIKNSGCYKGRNSERKGGPYANRYRKMTEKELRAAGLSAAQINQILEGSGACNQTPNFEWSSEEAEANADPEGRVEYEPSLIHVLNEDFKKFPEKLFHETGVILSAISIAIIAHVTGCYVGKYSRHGRGEFDNEFLEMDIRKLKNAGVTPKQFSDILNKSGVCNRKVNITNYNQLLTGKIPSANADPPEEHYEPSNVHQCNMFFDNPPEDLGVNPTPLSAASCAHLVRNTGCYEGKYSNKKAGEFSNVFGKIAKTKLENAGYTNEKLREALEQAPMCNRQPNQSPLSALTGKGEVPAAANAWGSPKMSPKQKSKQRQEEGFVDGCIQEITGGRQNIETQEQYNQVMQCLVREGISEGRARRLLASRYVGEGGAESYLEAVKQVSRENPNLSPQEIAQLANERVNGY